MKDKELENRLNLHGCGSAIKEIERLEKRCLEVLIGFFFLVGMILVLEFSRFMGWVC